MLNVPIEEGEVERLRRYYNLQDHFADMANEAEKAALENVNQAMALYERARANRITRLEARDRAKAELDAALATDNEGETP